MTPVTPMPLGVIPRQIWDDMRYTDIVAAVHRYALARIEIPSEWLEELDQINQRRK